MSMMSIFVSYVHEDEKKVDRIVRSLKTAGYSVWRDKDNLTPGVRWEDKIEVSIKNGDFFIACFSDAYNRKMKTYMNKELDIAIEQLILFPRHRTWFIPVKLDQCEIPNIPISNRESLAHIQYADLAIDFEKGMQDIFETLLPHEKRLNGLDAHLLNTVSHFTEGLYLKSPSQRCNALQHLVEIREAWIGILQPIEKILLEDENTDVQCEAIRCIGKIAEDIPEALIALLGSLKDKNLLLRKASLRALMLCNGEHIKNLILISPEIFCDAMFETADSLTKEDSNIVQNVKNAIQLMAPTLHREFYDSYRNILLAWLEPKSLLADSAALLISEYVGEKAIPDLKIFLNSAVSERLKSPVTNNSGIVAGILASMGKNAIETLPELFIALHRNPDQVDEIWKNIRIILKKMSPIADKKIGKWRPEVETRMNGSLHPDDHAGMYTEEFVDTKKTIGALESIIEEFGEVTDVIILECIEILKKSIEKLRQIKATYIALYEPRDWDGNVLAY